MKRHGHMTSRISIFRTMRLVAVLLAACVVAEGAAAQNPAMQELLNRVDRLQRELSTLQRQVYRGETPPSAAAPDSGAPPAPASAGVPSDVRTAARNSIRITQLENELRALTGRLEEVDYVRQTMDEVRNSDHRIAHDFKHVDRVRREVMLGVRGVVLPIALNKARHLPLVLLQ